MLLMALFTLLAAIAVSSITQGMIFITLAMGVFNMTLAGVSVNHLDIAPQYASVVYGIGNTAAQIPGIIGVWFTGVLLDWTHGNWTVVFGLAASLSALGAVCWFLMVGTRPVV
jgi:ACS family sodium-dependent inorganic phosphate cotransporter